ncbi:hypothetical protein Hanom_Chr15g01403391 [Helianthus anomalus]
MGGGGGRGLTSIESYVLGKPIIVTEDIIRQVLNLNDDNNVLIFTRAQISETLTQMGYNPENPNRPISKTGFIKPWQYLVTQIGVCFSKKIISHHEAPTG